MTQVEQLTLRLAAVVGGGLRDLYQLPLSRLLRYNLMVSKPDE